MNGEWKIEVEFQGDYRYVSSGPAIILDKLADPVDSDQQSFFTARVMTVLALILVSTLLLAAYMYRNYVERRRIEVLRGILTDSLWALQGRNSYIETIFNCYKDLVKFFRQRGAMKKVYETTREFEYAVNKMLGGIAPPRTYRNSSAYSRKPGIPTMRWADQRDRAIAALQNIITHLSKSLGESMLSRIRSRAWRCMAQRPRLVPLWTPKAKSELPENKMTQMRRRDSTYEELKCPWGSIFLKIPPRGS